MSDTLNKNVDKKIADSCKENFKPKSHQYQKRRISSISNLSSRLTIRRTLHIRRKILAETCLVFGIMGILLMILVKEMDFKYGASGANSISWLVMRIFISLLTGCLMILILLYYVTGAQLFLIDNCLDRVTLAINWRFVVGLILELFVCLLHPFSYFFIGSRAALSESDRILSLLMCLRIYLMVRVLVLHSWINRNYWTHSLSSFNQVDLNFRFVLKSVMNRYPVRVIVLTVVVLLLWSSWALRVCEVPNGIHQFGNSIWMVAVTFLGIGYGDVVPITACGRVTAVLTGLFGASITALTVAILASKLELTKSESYVHYFVIGSELNKSLRVTAANIIKQTWKLHKSKKNSGNNYLDTFCPCTPKTKTQYTMERKLLDSIFTMVELRRKIKHMHEESDFLPRNMQANYSSDIVYMKEKMNSIESSLNEVKTCLSKLTKQ